MTCAEMAGPHEGRHLGRSVTPPENTWNELRQGSTENTWDVKTPTVLLDVSWVLVLELQISEEIPLGRLFISLTQLVCTDQHGAQASLQRREVPGTSAGRIRLQGYRKKLQSRRRRLTQERGHVSPLLQHVSPSCPDVLVFREWVIAWHHSNPRVLCNIRWGPEWPELMG